MRMIRTILLLTVCFPLVVMCSGSAPETSEPDTSWEEPLWSVPIEDLQSTPSAVKTDIYMLNSPWDTRIFNNDTPVKCPNPAGLPTQIPDRLENGKVDQKAWDEISNVNTMLILSDLAAEKGSRTAASCILDHLYYWAQNNAFIVDKECTTGSGEHWIHGYDRSNFINGVLAIPYLQIRNNSSLDKLKKTAVISWFEKLYVCSKTRAEGMLANSQKNGLGPHNQTYPALLAVATTSLILDKSDEFKWAIEQYKKSIATISEDGTSANETAHKKGWTIHYHTVIVNFSVHLALLGEINGFTGLFNDPSLLLLTKQVLDSYDDSSYLKKLTGYEQTQDPLTTPWNLSWTEHMKRYNEDPRITKLAKKFQWKMDHSHTGGHPEYWWQEYWK